MTQSKPDNANQPAWKNPYVWMVLGGPLVVVVASITTFFIAARNPDPVLETRAKPNGTVSTPAEDAMVPAVQGRNHATTGGVPQKN
ncbi:hypothetical protein RQP54_15430 [Curvibacter sp. APW13]|uniref:hypothetical protein n=1 Tax=Curvibacter sp. APW13 TaxID=3077236 RepID=UPI0028DFACF7|nr:hypothetical protein [Curvibacter sp. APW13]MDT8992263.1 hypothetical protein [Curvibacter sp. APW13]